MNKLVIANLLHRPVRSMISIFGVAIEVIMILSIAGIFVGILNDSKARTNGIGADMVMQPSNASVFNGVNGAPMSIKLADVLRTIPHVAVVSPAVAHMSNAGSIEVVWGIDYASFNALKPFEFLDGGPFQGPDDVIIDDVLANSDKGHKVGDSLQILNHAFRICGIVKHGRGGRKLLPITTMNQIVSNGEEKASAFYMKSDDPKNEKAIIQAVHATKGLENYPVLTMEELMSQLTPDKVPGFNIALNVVTGIAVIVGFLVIFQSMYMAVLERTREIGILKSMGSSKASIMGVILRETAVIAVVGVIFGVIGVYLVRLILLHIFPTMHFEVSALWIMRGVCIAFVGALFGAIYPAWLAARKDPIDALAYE